MSAATTSTNGVRLEHQSQDEEQTRLMPVAQNGAYSAQKLPKKSSLTRETNKDNAGIPWDGPKASKLLAFCRNLSLGKLFGVLGRSIGTCPLAFCIASLILASLSVGMYQLKLRDRVRDGYTPATSKSRYETDVFREFLGSAGDPVMTTVLLRARDGGSMHRLRYLDEAVRLHRYFRKNISALYRADEESEAEQVRYVDICGPFCDANIAIEYFAEALTDEYKRHKAGKKPSATTKLVYPIAKLNGYELHLERNLYAVLQRGDNFTNMLIDQSVIQRNLSSIIDPKDEEVNELKQVTPIEHVEAIMMNFRGDISDPSDEAKMANWEMRVYEFSKSYNSSIVEMLVIGTEIVDYEMNKDAQKTAPYFGMGFGFMFAFVFATVLGSSYFYGVLDPGKLLLAFGVTLCPLLSVTCTFGICTLVGLRTNSVMLIMPFLISGIGVNDAFLMTHAWHRNSRNGLDVVQRLGMALEDVGPSITITTLTNVITFAIGALTPTPEISLFCLATAIALGFAYIFTLILFGPFIYAATIIEDRWSKKPDSQMFLASRKKVHNALHVFSEWYCVVISHKLFFATLCMGAVVYWYFAVAGTLNINSKLDTEKILPIDCPIREPHRLISHMVWTEYYPVTVFVNNPLDIRRTSQLQLFNAMVDEFERMPLCKGKEFTVLWLRDYIDYCEQSRKFGFDYFFDDDATTTEAPKTETGVDFRKIPEFLTSPFYKHYKSFIKLVGDASSDEVPVSKFWFTVTFHNASTWQDRIDLMQAWREVADRYKELNVTVWEVNGMFVDQMLSLKMLTTQTGCLTLICMTLVCALFIQNPFSVLIAVLAIGSISIGVIGYLSWWHLDLDPVTLCAVLMSIGMSVDFTAHVSYHFQLKERAEIRVGSVIKVPMASRREKLYHTIQAIGWPMTQAGISTVICVLPLILLQNYIPGVFFKTISLVVIWGLFHGLVMLPAFLVAFPRRLLELNCYEELFKKVNGSSRSDVDTILQERVLELQCNDETRKNGSACCESTSEPKCPTTNGSS
ncbi:CRE-PTR-5 protein [Aphelenchoides avenae]|nr:CRE-PTR-5 protein [Aphelenchus avenae]